MATNRRTEQQEATVGKREQLRERVGQLVDGGDDEAPRSKVYSASCFGKSCKTVDALAILNLPFFALHQTRPASFALQSASPNPAVHRATTHAASLASLTDLGIR